MGESRTELLAWLNDLLQLGYTKVEQCGSGAAYCQILDSIFRDAPVSKVKFDARHEYEYVQNYKILQTIFDKHKIENHIPVERLTKCKMQDNLEFLQWMKKYWDTYFPGGNYDAIGRRKGAGKPSAPGSASPRSSIATSINSTKRPSVRSSAAPTAPLRSSNARAGYVASTAGSNEWEKESTYAKTIDDLTQQATELKVTVEGLEKERDFYFGKLREIEVIVQRELEHGKHEALMKEIQQIMYKTEDGFEIPDPNAEVNAEATEVF